MEKPTLQTIFRIGFAAYIATKKLPAFIYKAAWCLMHCRTEVMGGHVQACPEGHFEKNHYNSCKHRICPLCAFIQVQRWLFKQKARLLGCAHYHVVFTIPHELNILWKYNSTLMTNMLFHSAIETIQQLLSDKKYLGAMPGIIASLHTWSKTLILHPHIHCLITGGGLNNDKWINLRRDYLFPIAAARILFQGKLLDAISKALANGQLILPPELTIDQAKRLIKKCWKKKWNIHIREKYTHGKGVLTYLARYLKGGPISNSRIVAIRDNQVTFHVGREKKQLMTLTIEEFIQRFLQHVPHPSCVVVRSYGLYASTKKKDLDLCHRLLGNKPDENTKNPTWQDILEEVFPQKSEAKESPWQCPICGKRLIVKTILPRQPKRPCLPNNIGQINQATCLQT